MVWVQAQCAEGFIYPLVNLSADNLVNRLGNGWWDQFHHQQPLVYCFGKISVRYHHSDVIMSVMASQITDVLFVYSRANQRKHQSSASPALWRELTSPVNSPAQMASNAEIISIWWRHHEPPCCFDTAQTWDALAFVLATLSWLISWSLAYTLLPRVPLISIIRRRPFSIPSAPRCNWHKRRWYSLGFYSQ